MCYTKPHVDITEWQNMEILWLPATVVHSEAMKLASDHGASLGLAVKQNQDATRFGLRFRNLTDMQTVATALGWATKRNWDASKSQPFPMQLDLLE